MIRMKVFFTFIRVISAVKLNDEKCGLNDNLEKRRYIFGGNEAAGPGRWPWACSLGFLKESDWTHKCGGSLITYEHLITAAHCVDFFIKEKKPFQVRCGDFHLKNSSDDISAQTRDVNNYVRYESYNLKVVNNDIAVIHLNQSLTETPEVRPICMTKDEHETLTVVGWGLDKQSRHGEALKQTTQKRLPPRHCSRRIGNQSWIDLNGFGRDLFCAVDQTGDENGSCFGDSGGPIFSLNAGNEKLQYEMNGIVNGGELCGSFKTPDIYTSTTFSPIYDWIREKVERWCLPRQECPAIQEVYDMIESDETDAKMKEELKDDLRKLICDRKKKLFYCDAVEKDEKGEKNWFPIKHLQFS